MDPIRGKTLRFTFDDGPMAGRSATHTFGPDGLVSWRLDDGDARAPTTEPTTHKYELAKVNDDVWLVSYLGEGGYTLTTVIDETTGRLVAVASNEKEVTVQRGRFEHLDPNADQLAPSSQAPPPLH